MNPMSRKTATGLIPLLLAACAPAAVGSAGPPATTDAAATSEVVEAGSTLLVRLDEPIGARTSAMTVGRFTATLLEPVRSPAGDILIPGDARLEGTVTEYVEEREWRPQIVGLEFDRLKVGHVSYDFSTTITEVDLAFAENGTTGEHRHPNAGVDEPAARPGTIVEDRETYFRQELREPEFARTTLVSLGQDREFSLPAGTRMTVELLEDLPLRATH
jgi:hypothetical protein